jgi:hypothetical protein
MSAHVLPPLAVNSNSERKVNSLPPLGFERVIFGMLVHLYDHSAKSHPISDQHFFLFSGSSLKSKVVDLITIAIASVLVCVASMVLYIFKSASSLIHLGEGDGGEGVQWKQ